MKILGPYLVAFVNLIAFLYLLKKDFKKNKEINQLEQTANELKKHNKISQKSSSEITLIRREIGSQTELQAMKIQGLKQEIIEIKEIASNLEEANKINLERNQIMEKGYENMNTLLQSLLIQQEEKSNLKSEKLSRVEKLKLKPKFKIKSYTKDKVSGTAKLIIVNTGGNAVMEGAIIMDNKKIAIINALSKVDVGQDEVYEIEWKAFPKKEIGNNFQTAIAFTDDIKNLYAQVFKSYSNKKAILTTTAEGDKNK